MNNTSAECAVGTVASGSVDEKLSIDIALLVKWAICILPPLAIAFLVPDSNQFPRPVILFFAVTLWGVLTWGFDIIPDVAVGLLLPVFYVVAGAATTQQVFGPWLSPVPWACLGGLIMGHLMHRSGLAHRIALYSLRLCGNSFTAALFCLALAGALITPFLVNMLAKTIIMCTVGVSMCEALSLKAGSRESTAIMAAAFFGVASPCYAYLTGGEMPIIAMTQLTALGTETSWMEYAKGNFLIVHLFTIMSVGIVAVLLRPKKPLAVRDAVQRQLAELKPMRGAEAKVLMILVCTLFLLITQGSLHHINPGIILLGMACLTFIPALKLFKKENFSELPMGMIFLITGTMAIGAAASATGAPKATVGFMIQAFEGSPLWAVSASYISGAALNFFLTPLAAIATFIAPMNEVANALGMDVRPLIYAFELGIDNYLLPYEYVLLLYFVGSGFISLKKLIPVLAVRMIGTGLLVALVAYPYWKWIGLI